MFGRGGSGHPRLGRSLTDLRPAIEAVMAPLERARPFPAPAFTSAELFDFEREAVFDRAWHCVGREEELALPGQWLRVEIGAEPILVVRGPDLRVRAFFDVCRHRGASVVGRKACGRDAKLECPYHGWTYQLDGRGREPLRAATVEIVNGFVFVAIGDAPEAMGEWPPWLTTLGPLVLGRRKEWVTEANWKLSVENFQESHHFPRVHRALEALTPMREAYTWSPSDAESRWLGGTMTIEGAETVSRTGALEGRPLIGPAGRVHDAMLFPLLLTSLQPDYLLLYRLSPLAPERTRIVFDVYFHPAANREAEAVYELWDEINAEDRAIIEDQQANARSRAFAPTCYEPVEEGMHAFDRLVARAYLAELERT